MKTDTKMKELKIKAFATREAKAAAFTTYSAACLAVDASWDAYNAATRAYHKASVAANVYEARTYGACGD